MGFRSIVLPRLSVTPDEADGLRATAARLEHEVVGQYEDFVALQKRRIDRSKWRILRSDGDLHAHQETRHSGDELGFMPEVQQTSTTLEPQATLAAASSVGRVLVTGTIPGTVDDALYGCSFHDTVSLRTQNAYQREFLSDSAVLYTLDGPTLQDPFRFMGITWHVRESRLSKTRECLLLQHTHVTTLSTGERIGVSLRHSIQHRDLPELHDASLARIVISSVTIFRQLSVGTVDVFGIEFFDDKRRLPLAVQRQEAARDLFVMTSVCDSGHKKKLHRLMRQRHLKRRLSSQGPEAAASADHRNCDLCAKSTRRMLRASGVCCQLCARHVCSRCTMTQEIVIDASTADVVAKPFAFCIECVLRTKKLSALGLAQDDVWCSMEMDKRRNGSPFVATPVGTPLNIS